MTIPHLTTPLNLNVDNLIHCIRRDQREAELLARWRERNTARAAGVRRRTVLRLHSSALRRCPP